MVSVFEDRLEVSSKAGIKGKPFVLAMPEHGRMIITEPCSKAAKSGLCAGMVVADARILFPDIEVLDDKADLSERLLIKLAHWCIRYTSFVE